MPPPKPAYDVDWVFASSDVHVANHRDWFISYTPFTTTLDSPYGGIFGAGVEVAGIGDVELPTKTHPTKTGTAHQGTIILRDVLYAPKVVCNIIGMHLSQDYGCIMDFGSKLSKITAKKTGACVGFFDMKGRARLRLRGQSAKQTSLDPNEVYLISAKWASGERARWKALQEHKSNQASAIHAVAPLGSAPLTKSEKTWLKDNFADEFHFLRAYELSIYEEEDREEGRRILRKLMDDGSLNDDGTDDDGTDDDESTENNEDSEDDEDRDPGSPGSFERELEEDPMSHFADRHFSAEELDWIKKHHGHSANFLLSYGLKFYDDEDCEQGKAIIQAFL
ncbi:MAG: hypothetical protein Q9172_001168 [Xanthocarpia lactea]